jgi:hypothetical protein
MRFIAAPLWQGLGALGDIAFEAVDVLVTSRRHSAECGG